MCDLPTDNPIWLLQLHITSDSLPTHALTNSDLDVTHVHCAAVLKQHRHIRVVKRGISFLNSLNLLGFKGLPGSKQLSAAQKMSRFCHDLYLQPYFNAAAAF